MIHNTIQSVFNNTGFLLSDFAGETNKAQSNILFARSPHPLIFTRFDNKNVIFVSVNFIFQRSQYLQECL